MVKNRYNEMRSKTPSLEFRNGAWIAVRYVLTEYWRDEGSRSYWRAFYNYHHLGIEPRGHSSGLEIPSNEPSEPTYQEIKKWLREQINLGEHSNLIPLLEGMLYVPGIPGDLDKLIEKCLDDSAPYYHIDHSHDPMRILPRSSDEMGQNTERARRNIDQSELVGAKVCLRAAAQELNKNDFAGSIRESISAVESAARAIDPKASNELSLALDSLEKDRMLKHPALKQAFKTLYGYTNDEEGIRHPLINSESPDVGFDEAIFMYGICVSFVDYLISKQTQIKEK